MYIRNRWLCGLKSKSSAVAIAFLALSAGPVAAQDVGDPGAEVAARQAEAARREAEREREIRREAAAREREAAAAEREAAALAREVAQVEREVVQVEREAERARRDVEVEMREAESRLAEAARRVAELSSQRLQGGNWAARFNGRPMLGVNIDAGSDDDEPVAGVTINSVTPGGAAADAGLRAGDIITAINGESLGADSRRAAGKALLAFMSGVEEGDELDVEYLRDGRSAELTVAPRTMPRVFSFSTDGLDLPKPPSAPTIVEALGLKRFDIWGGGFGDLEMVALTEGLGRYFGSDTGLLVVRAPEDADTYKLLDGDVILSIDGREPGSVPHAVRILASYQAGETLEVVIMRDKSRRTLEIEIPDSRTGSLAPPMPPLPPSALPPRPVLSEGTVIEAVRDAD